MKYFCISRCEDEPYFEILTENQVKTRLTDDWKDYEHLKGDEVFDLYSFPSHAVLIIKGDIVIPQKVNVVTEFKL